MLSVQFKAPSLKLRISVREAATVAAEGMRDHWAKQLDRGLQPDGEPLPLNKEGKPLGRGNGTLVRRWRVRKLRAKLGAGRAAVEPYTGGRYKIAVARLRARGLRFQSFGGQSRTEWDRVAGRVTHIAMNAIEWTGVES